MIHDPVGVSEIAARAGVRAATVQQWRYRHPDFPPPTIELAMGPIWEWETVAEWLSRDRPAGRPRGS